MHISYRHILLFLAISSVLAGCSGDNVVDNSRSERSFSVDYANWQPQLSAKSVIPLEEALASGRGISSDGLELLALDAGNRPDLDTLVSLSLERHGNDVVISSRTGIENASLYLVIDGSSEHVQSVRFSQDTSIGISLAVNSDVQAIGVSGRNGRLLSKDQPIAVVTLAAGQRDIVRYVSDITNGNNKVGIVDQQKLIAQDDGEAIATLSWRERLTGDYDLNGLVTIADISPIGQQLGNSYDLEDPDASGKVEVVDGDINGLITIADISPIGQNFGTQLTGYDVYRTELADASEDPTDDFTDARWGKIDNASDASLPSADRSEVPNNGGLRITYTFVDNTIPDAGGDYAWVVVPRAGIGEDPNEGPVSNVAKSNVTPKGAGVNLVIQDPATGTLTVGDEFWVAVEITDVIGLFSANMRFEYDNSLIEVVEVVTVDQIVADYDDGGFTGTNMLSDPLFIGIDNVAVADSPYVLLGFNDTQKQGTAVVDGSGAVGFVKFRAVGAGVNAEAIRWPQSSTFILLWGAEFGVPASAPILGAPLALDISPAP